MIKVWSLSPRRERERKPQVRTSYFVNPFSCIYMQQNIVCFTSRDRHFFNLCRLIFCLENILISKLKFVRAYCKRRTTRSNIWWSAFKIWDVDIFKFLFSNLLCHFLLIKTKSVSLSLEFDLRVNIHLFISISVFLRCNIFELFIFSFRMLSAKLLFSEDWVFETSRGERGNISC